MYIRSPPGRSRGSYVQRREVGAKKRQSGRTIHRRAHARNILLSAKGSRLEMAIPGTTARPTPARFQLDSPPDGYPSTILWHTERMPDEDPRSLPPQVSVVVSTQAMAERPAHLPTRKEPRGAARNDGRRVPCTVPRVAIPLSWSAFSSN